MQSIWPLLAGITLLLVFLSFRELFREKKSKVLVTAWGDLSENRVLIGLLDDFRKEHPLILIELERIPFDDYVEAVSERIARGRGPDVLFVEVSNFADFYFKGLLEPLNPYIRADQVDLGAFQSGLVNRFTVEQKTYALPRDTALYFIVYYNQQAFDEAGIPYPEEGWTWDRFVEAAKRTMKIDAMGQVTRWGLVEDQARPEAWVHHAGGSYVDDVNHPTRWTFARDPETLKGVQFHADLIHKHKVMPSPSTLATLEGMTAEDLFVEGKAAMFLSGLWKTPRFREIKDFCWDIALFPRDTSGNSAFAAGGSGYAIHKSSKHKKAAWEFVKFITGEKSAAKLAATGLAQPALVRMADSPIFLDGQPPAGKRLLLEAVKSIRYTPLCRNWIGTHGMIVRQLEQVFNGTQTAEEAMEYLRARLQANPPLTK